MSYNTTSSQLASVTRAQLAQMITDLRRTVTDTERPLIELAGQTVSCVLSGVGDDVLVDLQLHGSDLPSQDARIWFVSITTRRITPKPEEAKVNDLWDPSQGPMILKGDSPVPTPGPAIQPTEPSGNIAMAPNDGSTPNAVASSPAPDGAVPPASPPNRPMIAAPGSGPSDTTSGT